MFGCQCNFIWMLFLVWMLNDMHFICIFQSMSLRYLSTSSILVKWCQLHPGCDWPEPTLYVGNRPITATLFCQATYFKRHMVSYWMWGCDIAKCRLQRYCHKSNLLSGFSKYPKMWGGRSTDQSNYFASVSPNPSGSIFLFFYFFFPWRNFFIHTLKDHSSYYKHAENT